MNDNFNHWVGRFAIRDTPGWQNKYPTGPVHFDYKCLEHNIIIENISAFAHISTEEKARKLYKKCVKENDEFYERLKHL